MENTRTIYPGDVARLPISQARDVIKGASTDFIVATHNACTSAAFYEDYKDLGWDGAYKSACSDAAAFALNELANRNVALQETSQQGYKQLSIQQQKSA